MKKYNHITAMGSKQQQQTTNKEDLKMKKHDYRMLFTYEIDELTKIYAKVLGEEIYKIRGFDESNNATLDSFIDGHMLSNFIEKFKEYEKEINDNNLEEEDIDCILWYFYGIINNGIYHDEEYDVNNLFFDNQIFFRNLSLNTSNYKYRYMKLFYNYIYTSFIKKLEIMKKNLEQHEEDLKELESILW
jgi:hypothetical protein